MLYNNLRTLFLFQSQTRLTVTISLMYIYFNIMKRKDCFEVFLNITSLENSILCNVGWILCFKTTIYNENILNDFFFNYQEKMLLWMDNNLFWNTGKGYRVKLQYTVNTYSMTLLNDTIKNCHFCPMQRNERNYYYTGYNS